MFPNHGGPVEARTSVSLAVAAGGEQEGRTSLYSAPVSHSTWPPMVGGGNMGDTAAEVCSQETEQRRGG
jgi:hypothetical protein